MANAILNVGQTGGQVNISTAAAPATPAVGVVTLYAGTDKALHVKNSDGTDITIAAGMTGPTGLQGQTGATGPAGSNATSPITKEQSNSLVSTGVGATAGVNSNCAVVIGNNACTVANVGQSSVVIGAGAKHCTYGSESVIIGPGAYATNIGIVSIGQNAAGDSQRGINIGFGSATSCNNALGAMAIGCGAVARGDSNCVGMAIGNGAITFRDGIHVGLGGFSCASQSTVVGVSSQSFPGATGTIVLGVSSVGATGACNSVVIGNTSCSLGSSNVVIGQNAKEVEGSAQNVIIGFNSFGGYRTGVGYNTVVGICSSNVFYSYGSVVMGYCNTGGAQFATTIGNCNSGDNAYQILIGTANTSNADTGFVIGRSSKANANNSGVYGRESCTVNAGAYVIGNNIVSEKTNTTHVQSLIAYGQAASKTHAVGSTGGTVAIDWDNSNVQTLTLTSSATVSMSNPIDGGVYTLQITQGGSGSYTATWSNIKWPGGTPPTLSTAVGALDVLTFIYGPTAYVGNANLNFS